jgi:hypothetical protein
MSYAGKKPLAVTARREKVPGAVVSHGSSFFQEGSKKWLWLSPLSVCVCSAAPCVRRDDVANNGVSFKPFVRH